MAGDGRGMMPMGPAPRIARPLARIGRTRSGGVAGDQNGVKSSGMLGHPDVEEDSGEIFRKRITRFTRAMALPVFLVS